MKKDIHPQYYKDAKITCACGASFEVGSTIQAIHVEICSNCHPFYTGKEKLMDTAGRVDKFKKRQAAAEGFSKSKGRDVSTPSSAKATAGRLKDIVTNNIAEPITDNK